MKKKLTQVLAVFLAILTLSADISAEQVMHISPQEVENFMELYETDRKKAIFYKRDEIEGLDGGWNLSLENASYFSGEKNYIITLELDFDGWIKWYESAFKKTVTKEMLEKMGYCYRFYTTDLTVYKYGFYPINRAVFTTKEIVSGSGVSEPSTIFYAEIGYYDSPDVASYSFHECKNGWNTIDGKKYYVKKDGTLVTKSCKIGGVRYKFTADGICRGRYTGWTKSAKGRRYWKNGELVTEKYIRTKSGKRYYADKDGYVTEV